MRVLVYGKAAHEHQLATIQQLFDVLFDQNHVVFIDATYHNLITSEVRIKSKLIRINNYEDLVDQKIDFVFTLGGDGTILSVATLIGDLIYISPPVKTRMLHQCIFPQYLP